MRRLQLDYEAARRRTRLGLPDAEPIYQLRHLVQNRQGLVMLFSGSHRFEELKTVHWAHYLINTKTLELSFLKPEEARE